MWTGITQALADASGYRIVLQAGVTEPVNDASNMLVFVNCWALPSGCPRCGAKLSNIELLGRGLTALALPFLGVFGWETDWAATHWHGPGMRLKAAERAPFTPPWGWARARARGSKIKRVMRAAT